MTRKIIEITFLTIMLILTSGCGGAPAQAASANESATAEVTPTVSVTETQTPSKENPEIWNFSIESPDITCPELSATKYNSQPVVKSWRPVPGNHLRIFIDQSVGFWVDYIWENTELSEEIYFYGEKTKSSNVEVSSGLNKLSRVVMVFDRVHIEVHLEFEVAICGPNDDQTLFYYNPQTVPLPPGPWRNLS